MYKTRNVLVTGHTGFKGSWLVFWLKMLGANVTGISLPAETTPSHWKIIDLDIDSRHIDICDEKNLRQSILEIEPEIVFHLAAQPLVRRSYHQPLKTWNTNVIGTANLLDACREVEALQAVVVITTDKCYDNKEWVWGYREIDPLGGHDPYSASKGGSELVTASYRNSFFNSPDSPLVASARAGNVIGGGDWSEDRLIPDLVRAVESGKPLEIRSPKATRPWQHVLECLSGYLVLGQKLLGRNHNFAEAWNFGPDREGNRQVELVLKTLKTDWPAVEWNCGNKPKLHEAQLLHLDSGKARDKLSWRPVWSFEAGVSATGEWYREWLDKGEIITEKQILKYSEDAHEHKLSWADGWWK